MKTKTELDENFEYPESKAMAKVALIFALTSLGIGIFIGALVYAFFYNSGFLDNL